MAQDDKGVVKQIFPQFHQPYNWLLLKLQRTMNVSCLLKLFLRFALYKYRRLQTSIINDFVHKKTPFTPYDLHFIPVQTCLMKKTFVIGSIFKAFFLFYETDIKAL